MKIFCLQKRCNSKILIRGFMLSNSTSVFGKKSCCCRSPEPPSGVLGGPICAFWKFKIRLSSEMEFILQGDYANALEAFEKSLGCVDASLHAKAALGEQAVHDLQCTHLHHLLDKVHATHEMSRRISQVCLLHMLF